MLSEVNDNILRGEVLGCLTSPRLHCIFTSHGAHHHLQPLYPVSSEHFGISESSRLTGRTPLFIGAGKIPSYSFLKR